MTDASHHAVTGVTGRAEVQRVGSGILARPREALALLRLAAGSATLLGVVLFAFGTSWDIQWHSFIGRDRALVPPHLLMLGGILLCGVAALSEVGIESVWARLYPGFSELGTPFAGAFSASLGAYVAGFAALAASVGFPLDVYWHSLYGIDVSVWAPFHVMIISGMSVAAYGVAHLLLSGANLAGGTWLAGAGRAGRIGVSVAFASMIWILFFFLDAAFDDAAIHIGGGAIDTFALMIAGFGGFALALAVTAVPSRFAASGVVAAYYAIDLAVFLFVPPLTEALRVAEHQTYRRGQPPQFVVVSFLAPILLILAGAAIDFAVQRAGRAHAPAAALRRRVQRAAVVGLLLAALLNLLYVPIMIGTIVSQDSAPQTLLASLAVAAALVLGVAGAWFSSGLGLDIGTALREAER
ncbi:MAG: hypothetical protein ACXWQR_07185 [Ktedonobacterales bacterium]